LVCAVHHAVPVLDLQPSPDHPSVEAPLLRCAVMLVDDVADHGFMLPFFSYVAHHAQ
jgi:hypothetical protein